MIGLMSTVAYAHNAASTVKAVNMQGYQYVNTTTLKVFFDKVLSTLNQGQFKIQTDGGTPVSISNMSTSTGSGWSNPQSALGTTVTLTTGQLSYDTRYKVIVSSTVTMGNSTTNSDLRTVKFNIFEKITIAIYFSIIRE